MPFWFIEPLCPFFFFFLTVATVPSGTVATVATFFFFFSLSFVLFFSFYIYCYIDTTKRAQINDKKKKTMNSIVGGKISS